MTRGLFLRADTDIKTVMAVWRRVMGVLCGRCAKDLRISPTKTTGGRRFASEAIFPAPVLTGRALSAIIKHTVRQSHSCGAPEN